jgi:type IV secretory pathway VirB4 component
MGGDWSDLGGALSDGGEDPVALQPLAWIDDPSERGWATEWIGAILAREEIEITPKVKDRLWSALTSLASARCRTHRDNSVKRALQPYLPGRPPMLARFIATDRGFAKFRRAVHSPEASKG